MRKATVLVLVLMSSVCFVPVSMAQEDAQGLYVKALRSCHRVEDYTCIMESYNRLGNKEEHKTYKYWYLKPGYVRMKVVKGKGRGGEVFYDPNRDRVKGHKGGFFSFVVLTLDPNDKRVTSIRGVRVDQTSFRYILSQFRPYVDADQCQKVDEQGMEGLVCSAGDEPYHGDIWKEKVLFNQSLLPVVWERYGKDGTLLYRLVCTELKINSGLTLKEISKGLEFKGK